MQKHRLLILATACCLTACVKQNTSDNRDQTYPMSSYSSVQPISADKKASQGTSTVIQIPERVVTMNIYSDAAEAPEVVRYDRYVLVGSSPLEGQKYLLEQLIEIDITPKKNKLFNATIRQGLNASLADTGFRLCHSIQGDTATLLSLPLPKIHYKFGPMRLREALQMIAGPAYDLTVNDIDRTVCFKSRPVMEREKLAIPKTEVTTTVTEIVETEE
jgi:integrating conjugative element protein pilL, PFGI-1 class